MGSAAEAECLIRLSHELRYLSEERATALANILSGTMRVVRGLLNKTLRTDT